MPNVVKLAANQTENDAWKRRLAIQIAGQLPEKATDALAVLALAEELIKSFLLSGGA